jgi:hypothetical protein
MSTHFNISTVEESIDATIEILNSQLTGLLQALVRDLQSLSDNDTAPRFDRIGTIALTNFVGSAIINILRCRRRCLEIAEHLEEREDSVIKRSKELELEALALQQKKVELQDKASQILWAKLDMSKQASEQKSMV